MTESFGKSLRINIMFPPSIPVFKPLHSTSVHTFNFNFDKIEQESSKLPWILIPESLDPINGFLSPTILIQPLTLNSVNELSGFYCHPLN